MGFEKEMCDSVLRESKMSVNHLKNHNRGSEVSEMFPQQPSSDILLESDYPSQYVLM